MSETAEERLGGRYRLLHPIGRGGMAVVWRARDEVLGRDVAVKLLAPQIAAQPGARERIRAEAQVIAKLSHPNITNVHDYGESDGQPYVVMELLEGTVLAARLREGPMSWRRATQICAHVAAALAAAHDRGVVHRDIKPMNVMLTPAGAKVLDFGVAGLAGSPGDDEPGGTVFGTPAYLAPERLLGDVIVPATDVYALGLLLYRCLTDRLPWQADTPTQMITNHVYERPQPLPSIAGLPADVIDLTTRCLAKEPADRPSAEQAARILAAASGIHVLLPDADGATTHDVPGGHERGAAASAGAGADAGQAAASGPGSGGTGTGAGRARPAGSHRVGARSGTGRGRRIALVAGTAAVAGAASVAGTWFVLSAGGVDGDVDSTVRGESSAARGRPTGCLVLFVIRPDGGGRFTARVTAVNRDATTRSSWAVSFALPGGERVTGGEGASLTQAGTLVTLTGTVPLPNGKAVTSGLTGSGGARPGMPPTGFKLNGVACEERVGERRDGWLPPVTGVVDPPPRLDDPRPPGGGPGGPGGGPNGPNGPPPGGPPPAGPPPSGPAPTGQVPTGLAPTGLAPTGLAPTGLAPSGS